MQIQIRQQHINANRRLVEMIYAGQSLKGRHSPAPAARHLSNRVRIGEPITYLGHGHLRLGVGRSSKTYLVAADTSLKESNKRSRFRQFLKISPVRPSPSKESKFQGARNEAHSRHDKPYRSALIFHGMPYRGSRSPRPVPRDPPPLGYHARLCTHALAHF